MLYNVVVVNEYNMCVLSTVSFWKIIWNIFGKNKTQSSVVHICTVICWRDNFENDKSLA